MSLTIRRLVGTRLGPNRGATRANITTTRRTACSSARSPGALPPHRGAEAAARAAARAQGERDQVRRRPAGLQPPLRRAEGRHQPDASTCTSRNTGPAASRRSTATSTRPPSTSSTARATRSTTASATTGRRATSRSCTTTASTSTSTPTRTSRRAPWCMKTKPMYLFMNMLFQKQVEPRHTEPAPGGEDFEPREEEDDFNHPKEATDGRYDGLGRSEGLAARREQQDALPGPARRRDARRRRATPSARRSSRRRTCRGRCRARASSSTSSTSR